MPLFRFLRKRKQTELAVENAAPDSHAANADLGYQKLEERKVLNATFTFDAAASLLTIDDFDAGSDLSIDQNTASINGGAPEDAYIFTLASGTFDDGGGFAPGDFEVSGDTLTVATDTFGADGGLDANVVVDGAVGADFIELTQADITDDIQFNSFEISNIQNLGNSLELNVVGDVTLDNLSVVDNDPLVMPPTMPIADLSITTAGSINVIGSLDNAIENVDSGIELNATGGNSDVTISAAVTTVEGAIEIAAGDEVTFTSTGSLTSADTGNLSVTANTDVAVDGDGSDGIVMAEGSILDAGSGEISLSSAGTGGGDIEISSITTSNATGTAVSINSNLGVIDGDLASSNIVAIATGAVVDINATTGVGDINALEVEVDSIDVVNTTTGNIDLIEGMSGGDINILNLVNTAATGNTSVQTVEGTITIDAAGTGITAEAGTVTLDANGVGSSVVVNDGISTTAGIVNIEADEDAVINALIETSGGDVVITSGNDVLFSADGDITSNDATVTISADSDGDGIGAITMADGALVDAGAGAIALQASDDIILGGLVTNSPLLNAVTVTTDGNVIDGGDTDIDISAASGRVVIRAGGDVGDVTAVADIFKADADAADAIETFSDSLDVEAGGTIAIDELSGSTTIVNLSTTGADSTAFFTSAGDLTFADAAPTVTNMALLVGGTLTLPAALGVTGDLRIEASDVAGTINLDADRLLFVSGETETLQTNVNQLDVSSGGSLTVTNDGNLSLIDLDCNFIAAQALDNLAINVTGVLSNLTVVDDVISGDVGDNISAGAISLSATGDIDVHDVVLADDGGITIEAGQDLLISAPDAPAAANPITSAGIVTTATGDISLDAGGTITMEDDGTVDAQVISGRDATSLYDPTLAVPNISLGDGPDAGGPVGGAVTLTANGDVTLSTVQTTNNTVDAVQITSSVGGVIDGGDTSTDIIADQTDAVVTIDAVTGVGSGNAVELQVANIDVDNVSPLALGNIELTEVAVGGDINVLHLDNDAVVGDITLTTENGTITVVESAQGGTGIEAVDGNVRLEAQDDGVASDSNIVINNTITTREGDVDLAAENDINFSPEGNIATGIVEMTPTGNVTVSADADGDGDGGITMEDGALVDAGAGTIAFTADDNITLGGLRTNNSTANAVLVDTASGSVLDGGDIDREIETPNGTTTINAGVDIGFVGGEDEFFKISRDEINPIETFTAAINATAGNAIAIDEQNPASVVTLSATTAFLTSDTNLAFSESNPAVTNLALLAGGTLTLPATLEVAGDLRVEGANITSGGIINLEADRLLFVSGSAADLNTTVNQLDVNSGGNLTVANTGDLQLIDLNCDFIAAQAMGLASDLTINVTGDLTVVDDVIAGDLGDNNSTGSVLLTSTGNTNVRDVVLADNGDITIQAAQDLTISTPDQPAVPDAVTSTGIVTTVTGDISLDAGGVITMEDDGTVDAQVIAGRVIEEPDGAGGVMPLLHDPEVPDIRLGGGADAGDPAGGTITLSAEDNITISTLQTTNNTIDAVRITSVSGEVIDSGDTSSDILANEDGAITTISAATGIGNTRDLTLPAPPVDAALDVQIDIVDATNSMAGDIAITEEATSVINDNPDIDILNLNNGADTGDIVVVAQNGTITVADEVDTVAPDGSALVLAGLGIEAQAGTVRLDAQDVATPPVPGSDSSVEINNRILTQGGVVDIDAADDVNFSAAGDVSTNGGDVTVSADPDNDGNGAITMTDGAVVDAGAGTITFEADQDITLGSLITTTDVNITTRGGGVIDGGDENTATAGVADIVADTATIVAKQGVGDADALELEVNNIDVDNSNEILTDPILQATGDINLIQEADGGDVNVLNLVNDAMTATGGGNISLTATDGTITVAAAGQGIAAQDGTVTLDAQDDDVDPAVGSASGVEINNTITTQGGDVNILAEDDVNFAAAGDILTNGGDVTVSADPDNDGNGAIVMTDGAVVDSGTGTVTFSADEDITLSSLVTTNATATAVTITTDGSVIDGDIVDDDTVADISAANGRVVIRAGGDVGVLDGTVDFFKADAGDINPIETFTAELDVVAGGVIAINELNPLSVIINAEASTAFFTSAGDLTFSDATPTVTNLALLVDGTLTLPTTLEVAGDLRIEGGDVDVATPDGIINLTANRLLFISESTALENLVTNVDQLDVTSTGNLTVNNSGDLELIDLNCDFIAAQTLGLASDLTISVAGDLLVVDDVIAGAEDDNVSTGSIMLTSAGNTEIHDVVLADNGDISIQAGQDLTLSTSDISSPTLPAVPPITSTGIVTTVGGNISLEAGDAITMEDDGTVDTQIIAG